MQVKHNKCKQNEVGGNNKKLQTQQDLIQIQGVKFVIKATATVEPTATLFLCFFAVEWFVSELKWIISENSCSEVNSGGGSACSTNTSRCHENKRWWIYQCECIAIKIRVRRNWIKELVESIKVLTCCCIRFCVKNPLPVRSAPTAIWKKARHVAQTARESQKKSVTHLHTKFREDHRLLLAEVAATATATVSSTTAIVSSTTATVSSITPSQSPAPLGLGLPGFFNFVIQVFLQSFHQLRAVLFSQILFRRLLRLLLHSCAGDQRESQKTDDDKERLHDGAWRESGSSALYVRIACPLKKTIWFDWQVFVDMETSKSSFGDDWTFKA